MMVTMRQLTLLMRGIFGPPLPHPQYLIQKLRRRINAIMRRAEGEPGCSRCPSWHRTQEGRTVVGTVMTTWVGSREPKGWRCPRISFLRKPGFEISMDRTPGDAIQVSDRGIQR